MISLRDRIKLELDLDKFIEAVRAKAAASPNFVYKPPTENDACRYQPDEQNPEGCIMGAGFASCGFVPDDTIENESIEALFAFSEATERKTRWLSYVQGAQDRQKTWGQSVAYADERVKL